MKLTGQITFSGLECQWTVSSRNKAEFLAAYFLVTLQNRMDAKSALNKKKKRKNYRLRMYICIYV